MSDFGANILIIVMIAIISVFIYIKNKNCSDTPTDVYKRKSSRKNNKHRKHKNIEHYDNIDYNDDMNALIKTTKNDFVGEQLNQEFIDTLYNKDYNDTITAINNLTPQKELFNFGFLPTKIIKPDNDNVNELVNLFMDKLNNEVKSNVSEFMHKNSGWTDMGKRKREKSGFEKQMEDLGLPGSLYNEPATKAPVKLIKILETEQHSTEDQIRFIINIVVQKENVKEQMVLKILFFMEKEDLKNGGDKTATFFNKKINEDGVISSDLSDTDQRVVIEQVFTVGYLSNEANLITRSDKFHNYGNVYMKDGTFDQEKILKKMLEKHTERQNELNAFKSTLSEEDKENIYKLKPTREIMRTLAKFPL